MKRFIAVAVLLAAVAAPTSGADMPKKISLRQFFEAYQALMDTHRVISVSGVYVRFAGMDLLYNDGPDSQTGSLTPIGGQRPIPLWIGSASGDMAARFHQCLYQPDKVVVKQGEELGQCDVTIIGHVESCVTWGVGTGGAVELKISPTRLLPGPPPDSKILACMVVDGGNAAL